MIIEKNYRTPYGEIPLRCRSNEWDGIHRWLEAYFAGEKPLWLPQMTLQGTPFQLRVWHLLEQIPYGETRTYGQLARQLSPTMSAQAVGQAVHRNPLPIIIPCHRVVGFDGSLTGYAFGTAMKQRLLEWESSTMG